MESNEAGPSRPRKPSAPHPKGTSARTSIHKLRPPPPPRAAPPPGVPPPTLPLKVLQGAGIRRTDAQRAGFSRETILVTRKTSLGSLLGRARGLVLDEGYTHLTLSALGAAIPHALLLLHALLDVLPYPVGKGGMWYEIRTGSVECVDEVGAPKDAEDEFAGLGEMEESAPQRRVRLKSSLTIELHIAPRPKPTENAAAVETKKKRKAGTKARPTAKKRRAAARAKKLVGAGRDDDGDEEEEQVEYADNDDMDEDEEEAMMNA